ncbi:interleukin-13 receptor subunit alpha-1 [Brienomyrus brachyistius]|uniref:interleukin-13 receptor subunit alpha-1 n=1 Tax=Brienomyrus brachyistius TaxID=42636 RepID=UPI0020B1FE58|nr:interleukin-13 receptor subunit alpha-1 [Brienomyrus brachyistius]
MGRESFSMHRELFLILNFWMAFASETNKTGMLPPPRNLSLERTNHNFCLRLSWSPPEGLNNSNKCAVHYEVVEKVGQNYETRTTNDLFIKRCPSLESGVMYRVKAKCINGSHMESKSVTRGILAPKEELIQNFECIQYASEAMNCTWKTVKQTEDLQLFYWYEGQPAPEPCKLYLFEQGVKMGCHLSGKFLSHYNVKETVYFDFSGTQGTSAMNNYFQRMPMYNVKPPPLQLDIFHEDSFLKLTWKDPGLFNAECWDYIYRYKTNESGDWKMSDLIRTTNGKLTYDQRYEYVVQVKAIYSGRCGTGETDWSLEKHYGQPQSPNWFPHVIVIIIPVLFTIATIICLIFIKKLRKLILPEIPNPRIIKIPWKSEKTMFPDLFIPPEDDYSKVKILKEPLQL